MNTLVKKQFLFLLSSCFVFLACSKPAGILVPPPPDRKKEKVIKKGDYVSVFSRNIDILFVVDNSGSMSTHQANLSRNITRFTDELQKTKFMDYHIGVLTSSMDTYSNPPGGRLVGNPKFVTRTTPNGISVLRRNLSVGVNGSGYEKFMDPLVASFSPQNSIANKDFFRANAYLAAILITDAEDQSDQEPQEAYEALLKFKGGNASKLLMYAAYIPSDDTMGCSRDEYGSPPTMLETFLGLFNPTIASISFNLCAPDFGSKLAAVTEDLLTRVSKVVLLQRLPIPDTIRVVYGSQTIPNDAQKGWVYDPGQNALVFGPDMQILPEPEGTEVQIEFESYSFDEPT